MLALVEDKSVVYTSFAKPDPKAGLFCLTCMFFSLRLLLQLLRVHVGTIGFTALGHPKPILPISCI